MEVVEEPGHADWPARPTIFVMYNGERVKAIGVGVTPLGKKRFELALNDGTTKRVTENEIAFCIEQVEQVIPADALETPFLDKETAYIWVDENNDVEAMKEFVKDGQVKPRFSLIPMLALNEVMHVMCYGAAKYAEHNYSKGQKNTTYTDAAIRHIMEYNMNKNIDDESKRHHLAHAIACLMMGLDNELVGVSVDGRNPVYNSTNK